MQSGDAFCIKASLSYPIFAERLLRHCKGATEAAALICALELDELNAGNAAE
jgi:hypothetical protein